MKPEISKPLYRSFTFSRASVDTEKRTVELAFSSELAYERWFGMEILDHSANSIRLDRLKDGAPLLVNHDPDCQIGVVESVSIGSDRVGRALVRFGKGEEAEEIFQDVLDGIRSKVSVGYMIHSIVLEKSVDGLDTYRVTDWEPYEVSIVSVPADNTVGVGRSKEIQTTLIEESKMEKELAAPAAPATAPVDVKAIEKAAAENARKAELQRIGDLEKIGQNFAQFGGVELARQHIAEGKTVDDLNAAILERAGKKAPPSGDLGLSEKEIQEFSFVRALHALANPTDRRAQEAAGYEIEVGRAAADKAGKASRGIMVPVDILRKPLDTQRRDLSVGTNTAGGYTVSTDLLASSFIELLRNRLAMARLGATTLNGLVGNIAIPRQTSGATAYWVAEAGSPTESQQAVDQVTMSPKTVGAFTDYSRKLLLQSSIDVESMVRNDLAKVIALEIDRVALYGTGTSNQPQGIKNVTGINTIDFGAATPTFAEIVQFETEIAADNADVGAMAYLTNATLRGALKSAPKVSGYPDFIMGSDQQLNGYRTEISNQVASGDIFFANWSDLLVGFWSGLDLMVDPYTHSTSGTVRIVALQDTDLAVRHPVSFCRGNNTL